MRQDHNIILPFNYKCRPYQVPFWEAMKSGVTRACLVWHRRAGKEMTCWNFMIMRAATKVGIYYYFFPHFSQGRKILWDGVNKDGFKLLNYIPKELLDGDPNSTEMKIRLKNGSIIQIIGTNNIDSIVGTNPCGCVFTEYSLQDPVAWQLIRPILVENGGWAVFNFCVKAGTLVFTKEGIGKIEDVIKNSKDGFTETNIDVFGLNGYNNATHFYNGGNKKLLKITTEKGYEISCTPNHQLWTGVEWKRADLWNLGDIIPIQRGQGCFGSGVDVSLWQRPKSKSETRKQNTPYNPVLDEDTAYLIGLIVAEGSWSKAVLCITNTDKEIIDFLHSRGFVTYPNDPVHHFLCSTEFVSFIEWMGLKKGAKNKDIPHSILKCPKNIVSAFLSGYFDGDGCATKRGTIHCDSVSIDLINQLHIVLLNYGIVCDKTTKEVAPTKRVKVSNTVHRLELTRSGSCVFFKEIGFRLSRKQERVSLVKKRFSESGSDLIPFKKDWAHLYLKGMDLGSIKRQSSITYKTADILLKRKSDAWLQDAVNTNYYYDRIKSIELDEGEVYDFVIPQTHSFCSNGIISHNTPRGSNHGKDLFDMATANKDWYSQLLTVRDTGIVSEEGIQKERESGMSEDFIQQEFYCSFTLGIEGSYYARYMQEARDENRIGSVPWQQQSKVYTVWDIGFGDSTSIIFYQIIAGSIHIIDYYENHGEGLPHYARVLLDKPYIYADHFAPHDIDSHQFSTGLSAREVGSSVGIRFTTLPTLKVRLEDGIEAARGIFPRVYMDEVKCKHLIKCLENYRKEFDDRMNSYKNRPRHDWTSHASDAFRYMAIATKIYVDTREGNVTDRQADAWYNQFNPIFTQ